MPPEQEIAQAIATEVAVAEAQEAETAAIVADAAANDAVQAAAEAQRIADDAAREEIADTIIDNEISEANQWDSIRAVAADLSEARTELGLQRQTLQEMQGALTAIALTVETLASRQPILPISSEGETELLTETETTKPEELPTEEGKEPTSEKPKEPAAEKRRRFRLL